MLVGRDNCCRVVDLGWSTIFSKEYYDAVCARDMALYSCECVNLCVSWYLPMAWTIYGLV